MKYYRCPHCGEKSIASLPKNTIYMHRRKNSFVHLLTEPNRLTCPACNKQSTVRAPYNHILHRLIISVVVILYMALITYSALIFQKHIWVILAIVPVTVIFAINISYGSASRCKLVPLDSEDKRIIYPVPNVSVELLEIAKNIHNYDIHAIKFDKNTYNVVFLERFKNSEVPIMFLKKTRAQITPIEAYIIKKEFVPDELLFVGSSFSIVDVGGNIIGKGKIHKIYQ